MHRRLRTAACLAVAGRRRASRSTFEWWRALRVIAPRCEQFMVTMRSRTLPGTQA